MTPEDARLQAVLDALLQAVDARTRATVAALLPPTPEAPPPPARSLLTTAEAAAYCGYKTTGALRKAAMKKRIRPEGQRGSAGTQMWSKDALDAFLRGEAPRAPGGAGQEAPGRGTVRAERPGPLQGRFG